MFLLSRRHSLRNSDMAHLSPRETAQRPFTSARSRDTPWEVRGCPPGNMVVRTLFTRTGQLEQLTAHARPESATPNLSGNDELRGIGTRGVPRGKDHPPSGQLQSASAEFFGHSISAGYAPLGFRAVRTASTVISRPKAQKKIFAKSSRLPTNVA